MSDMLDSRDRKHLLEGVKYLARSGTYQQISNWAGAHGGTVDEKEGEDRMEGQVRTLFTDWEDRRGTINEAELENLRKGPLGGRCDSLGQIMVKVTGISAADVEKNSLVVRSAQEKEDRITAPQPQREGGSKAKSGGVQATENETKKKNNELGDTISNGHPPLGIILEKVQPPDPVVTLTAQLHKSGIADDTDKKKSTALGLPILVGEYKRSTDGTARETGTNQLRMYLTASVKYLEAIGITDVPVYGVQTEGPIAVFSAAVIKGENKVCTLTAYVLGHITDGIYSIERPSIRAAGD